jgi:hypothetical protein
MMPNELKPCPLCGGEAKILACEGYWRSGILAYEIVCSTDGCQVSAGDRRKYKAIRHWNRRAIPECVRSLVAFASTYAQPSIGVGEYPDALATIAAVHEYYGETDDEAS